MWVILWRQPLPSHPTSFARFYLTWYRWDLITDPTPNPSPTMGGKSPRKASATAGRQPLPALRWEGSRRVKPPRRAGRQPLPSHRRGGVGGGVSNYPQNAIEKKQRLSLGVLPDFSYLCLMTGGNAPPACRPLTLISERPPDGLRPPALHSAGGRSLFCARPLSDGYPVPNSLLPRPKLPPCPYQTAANPCPNSWPSRHPPPASAARSASPAGC